MNKKQTVELLKLISENYPNFVFNDKKVDIWLKTLQQYDYDDVKKSLDNLMADDYFQKTPPIVNHVVKGLTKKHEKIDYDKMVYICDICHRRFNDYDELDIHFDRCSSVRYILQQYKKFKLDKSPSKKELYEMSDEEFDERYKKLLRWIQKYTTDENEKQLIEFIFNPPRKYDALKFIEKGGA